MNIKSSVCSICMESDFVDSDTHLMRKFTTKCNHFYHYDCIYRWALINNSCPTCRTNNLIDNIPVMHPHIPDNEQHEGNGYEYDYDYILYYIRNSRLYIGEVQNTDDHFYNDLNIYIENLSQLFSNNLDISQNIFYNRPNNNNHSIPINLQMSINNTNNRRNNHPLSRMNFRHYS